jgi:hypothetical protein
MALFDHVGQYALSHGAAADVAVADEKYFNHCYLVLLFAGKCRGLQGFRVFCKMCCLVAILANSCIVLQVITTC